MTLPHAEALAMIDALEELMRYPDASGGWVQLSDIYQRMLGATRASVVEWHRAVYAPAHPEDERCVHGIVGCPECGNPGPKLIVTDEQLEAVKSGEPMSLRELLDEWVPDA